MSSTASHLTTIVKEIAGEIALPPDRSQVANYIPELAIVTTRGSAL